jgi:hypothetical protein
MTVRPGWGEPAPALVTLHLWRVPGRRVPAAVVRMGLDRRVVRGAPGVRFAKLLGTGRGQTFTLRDAEPRRWGLLAAWADAAAAASFERSVTVRRWHRLAEETWRVELRPLSSRGRWSGREPFGPSRAGVGTPGGPSADASAAGPPDVAAPDAGWPDAGPPDAGPPDAGPPDAGRAGAGGRPVGIGSVGEQPGPGRWTGVVAAVTRARLVPWRAARFWRAVPAVSADLRGRAGLRLAVGIGEAPAGLQGTFSVWESARALRSFAYAGAAHAAAIRRTPVEGWYAEELFARFAVLSATGTVDGRDPLA